MLSEIIQETIDKGIAEWSPALEKHSETIPEGEVNKDEKVLLVRLDPYGINTPLLIQKSDGSSLYATRDLATAKYRVERWNPEQIIYVVGGEQRLYFQQWFKVFELLGYNVKCLHVWFGLLRLPEGRMSTRKGRVVFLEDLLNEAIRRARNILNDRDLPGEEKEEIAKIVGIGAVKYADLSQQRTKDIVFDWEKMLNLEGDSAPYIQYAHTRAQSILRKSKCNIQSMKNIEAALLTRKEEIALIKRIAKFPEVVLQAAEKFEPNHIANYLFYSAQEFSKFYREITVLKAETESLRNTRLKLVEMIGTRLKKGLSLLDIEVPGKM